MLLTNLRGYKSKETCLKKIVRKITPSMIVLNETQLIGNMKVNIPQYVSWTRSRTDKGGGGVATAVSRQYSDSAIGAGEGGSGDEYLITKIDAFSPALTVVNSYGEQRKTNKEEVEGKWARLKNELETIRRRGEFCVYTGDLNKLVGQGVLGVPGTSPEISLGGKLLREMLATKDWVLVNGQGKEIVEGGRFTRQDPASGKLSCLDLTIVSRELWPYVDKLVIDSDRKMTPARTVKRKGKYKLIYTDHFSTLLSLKNLPRRKTVNEQKKTMWNIARLNGWDEYKNLTNVNSGKLEKHINDNDKPLSDVMKKFEAVMNDIKFKAFGKVTINNNRPKQQEIDEIPIKEKEKRDEIEAEELFEEQEKAVNEELEKIKACKNGKAGKIWNIRKKVLGGKDKNMVSKAITNPKNGKMTLNKKEIKEVTLKYCMETLSNNKPDPGYEDEIKKKIEFVKQFMLSKDGEFEASKDTFDYNITKFKNKGKKKITIS